MRGDYDLYLLTVRANFRCLILQKRHKAQLSLGMKVGFDAGLTDEEINALVEQRQKARQNRDFKTADQIRDTLKAAGIIVEDTPHGVRWRRA